MESASAADQGKGVRPSLNREITVFIGLFLVIVVVVFGAYQFVEDSSAMRAHVHQIAVLVRLGLGVIDEANLIRPDTIEFRGFRLTVVPDCSAIPSMAIFSASVIAFSTSWRKKLLGLLLGLPILFVVNVFRLMCLTYMGAWNREIFDFIHVYVWQGIFIVFVIFVWILWIETVVKR